VNAGLGAVRVPTHKIRSLARAVVQLAADCATGMLCAGRKKHSACAYRIPAFPCMLGNFMGFADSLV